MQLTGYLISIYEDINPHSPTYGQTRTEREQDTSECTPPSSGNWVIIYDYCEIDGSNYTGYLVSVYQDVDPNSPTYGERLERRSYDVVSCPLDSTVPIWELIDTYCEQVAYQPAGVMGNTGYRIEEWKDVNEYSETYNQIDRRRIPDTANCEMPDTNDVWVVVGTECELENGVRTGNKITYRVETNEYSPNYNFGQTETLIERDLINCPRQTTAPDWELQSATCEYDSNGYATGYLIETYVDDNSLSSTYGQTKEERVYNASDCPPETPKNIRWKVVNNRSVTTDTVTSSTIHLNYNFNISVSGSIPPAGGELSGTTVLPKAFTQSQLVVQSVDISPNAAAPTTYHFSQSPNPYEWGASVVLTVTLWDGDQYSPEWTETSYVCETSGGYNTGNAIITETDMNENSSTYNQTRTRTVQNDPRCQVNTAPEWTEISYTCETVNGFNTGNAISHQEDTNPNSLTYGNTRNMLIEDTTRCPISTSPAWVEISYVCEQDSSGARNYKWIRWWEDTNTQTIKYGQTDCDSGLATPEETCCTKIIFGDCCTSLPADTFKNCSTLYRVDLGHSITSIGERSFFGCRQLTYMTIRNLTPPTIGNYVFDDNHSSFTIYVPAESVTAYQTAWPSLASIITAINE